MSDLFEVGVGFSLEDAHHKLQGTGVPGTTQDTIDAPLGSGWTDISTGLDYRKKTAGSGTDKWVRVADQDQIDAINTNNPWRPPARIFDPTVFANVAAANSNIDGAGGIVDSVQLADGDRVVLAGLTGNPNVFVVVDTAGTFSYTEDTKVLEEGDAILITEGTQAEKQYVFDTANGWGQINADGNIESGFIRTFIGKDNVGSETPDYLLNTIVPDGDSLELGIGKLAQALDINTTAIGALQTTATNLQTELDDTQTGAGLNANGSFTADGTTNYLTAATDLQNESKLLDTQVDVNEIAIGVNATSIGNNATAIGNNATELTNIRNFVGKAGAGATTPTYSGNNVVSDGDTHNVAIGKLDVEHGTIAGGVPIIDNANTISANLTLLANQLNAQANVVSATIGSTPTVLDSVPVGATGGLVEWELFGLQGIKRNSVLVRVTFSTADRDLDRIHRQRVNGNIAGFFPGISVAVNGANLELTVSANASTTFTSVRRDIITS